MSNDRKGYSPNENLLLFSQVEGICPICTKSLSYEKLGNIHKQYELAHIYPLNPSTKEMILLQDEKMLSVDANNIDNIIPLCLNCHEKFDKPRTVEEYQMLFKIKMALINKEKMNNTYALFNVEDEIREVLTRLELDFGELVKLQYTALKVEEKSDGTLSKLLKKQIINDVIDYFNFIQGIFVELDKVTPDKFNTLAAQIKGFYWKCRQTTQNQEEIYRAIVDWIHNRTGRYSIRACEIIVSFFVQDCEVF